MLGAPFFHVGFADFWLADQLNSLANALLDFQFLTCFYYIHGDNWTEAGDTGECMERSYIIRPIVNCIPAWIRLAQCLRRYHDTREAFPHLVNAGKYSTTFFVVIFSTLRSMYKSTYPTSLHPEPYILCKIFFCCRRLYRSISESVPLLVHHRVHHQLLLRLHLGYKDGLGPVR